MRYLGKVGEGALIVHCMCWWPFVFEVDPHSINLQCILMLNETHKYCAGCYIVTLFHVFMS